MIQVEGVSKIYRRADGEVRALDDVTMSIEAGEFVVVRGASGSGKSTLLLTVGCMVAPTTGTVRLDGEDVYALSGRQRAGLRAEKIGFVFQMFHLVPYLNAVENVLVPTLAGTRVERGRAVELLERLGLGDRLSHVPAELSTGEKQRVALARALIKQPAVILADEPTGNLDPASTAEVLRHLAEFHAAGGTVVVVTHDARLGEIAQRTMTLERGRLSEV